MKLFQVLGPLLYRKATVDNVNFGAVQSKQIGGHDAGWTGTYDNGSTWPLIAEW